MAQLLGAGGFTQVQVEKRELLAVFAGGPAQLSASLAASGVAGDVAGLSGADRAALDQRITHHLAHLTVGGAVEAMLRSNVATAVKPE